jgi:uncharacterized protein (TIGR03083 family)
MMTTETEAATTVPPIEHREAMVLAETAYGRFADVVEALADEDWARPTDCEGWSVRDLVGHMVGAMRSAASMREQVSQMREIKGRVRRDGGSEVDHMTQVQIDRAAGLDRETLVAECRSLVVPATTGRRRVPAPMRRLVSIPVQMGDTIDERWRIGYLIDVILTRDAWLHRMDLCRAVGVEPELDAEHDGRIIADVAAEWARRHGRPSHLVLTGPAGGTFISGGAGAEVLELDAVEFCRILSGRTEGDGLLATEVPF